ncbi:MAG: bifunctional (p)ppGpp synthetase/guanosine-3',5'-bis(diphosphate) 3'-pyrophosphohydrolase, partial [Atopobiaceae bacterium]|nr:bifunctional (p)ppGpp synthetase/guanosine-3',5'-bis(diphosphate) 3'-pyrophosphohydrolase [Atopobiaceae bacterium]
GNSHGRMSADDCSVDTQINWIRRTLDWTTEEEIEDPHEFMDNLVVDLYEDEIFVFTPKGEVMSLRRDSTPLDFAYAVHTEVGNHCIGAKVNGSMVPLTYKLQSGDRVEIITNKNAKPGHDWLKMVATPSARSKIRKYFASETKEDDAERGRGYLAIELRKHGLGISSQRVTKALEKVCETTDYHDVETMLAAVGTGRFSPKQLAHRLDDVISLARPANEIEREARRANRKMLIAEDKPMVKPKTRSKHSNCGVVVKGDPDLLVHLAHCCSPVAGDEIVGFITRGRGVSVHRTSCPNVQSLREHPERMIEVEWDASGATEFQVEIVVEATDRMGLLKDVTIALSEAGCNILSAATQTGATGVARLRFLISLSNASLLAPLLARVGRVPSVYDARRIEPGEGAQSLKRRG